MQPSIRRKLEQLAERHEELEHMLASAEVLADAKRLRDVSREHSHLTPLTESLRAYDAAGSALQSAQAMLRDPEMKDLAQAEIATLETTRETLENDLNRLLIPKDPRDEGNLFLEIRAGTGGDEAAIFAGDLLRMYLRYAERRALERRDAVGERRRTRRLQGSHRARRRRQRISRDSSTNRAPIACSACRPPRRRAVSIPPPPPSRSCRKWMRSTRSN